MTRKEIANEVFKMTRINMENIHIKDVAIWNAIAELNDFELFQVWKEFQEDI